MRALTCVSRNQTGRGRRHLRGAQLAVDQDVVRAQSGGVCVYAVGVGQHRAFHRPRCACSNIMEGFRIFRVYEGLMHACLCHILLSKIEHAPCLHLSSSQQRATACYVLGCSAL